MIQRAARVPDDEIRKALEVLVDPDQTFEIRAPKAVLPGATKPKVLTGFFTGRKLAEAAKFAREASRHAPGVYVTLNAVDPAKAKSRSKGLTTAKDVIRRRLVLIDCDPVKAEADSSSTEDEKAASLVTAQAVMKFLRERGIHCLILIDSGNGYHVLIFVDLPTDDAGLVERFLKALASRFDTTRCKVDTKVSDAPRITKIPGTEARKGESTPDRPHRFAKLLEAPDDRTPVTAGQLKDLVDELSPTPEFDLDAEIERKRNQAKPTSPRREKRVSSGHTAASEWTPERRAIAYLEKCEPSVSGQNGHNKAFWAACQIGPGFDLTPETTFRLLNDHFSPRCHPRWSEAEIRHKVEQAYLKRTERGFLLNVERKSATAGRNGRHNGAPPSAGTAGDGTTKQPDRPQIEINTQRHEVTAEAIKALARDSEIYCRNGELVVVVEEERDADTLGTPKIVRLAESTIGCMLTKNAEFYAWRKDKSGEDMAVPVHPTDWLIKAVRDEPAYPGIRPLVSVAECPFPRPDGSIVETPGYDSATRILYRPTIEFPKVADRPTRDDARAAWETLQEPIKDFPFAAIDDKIAWLAGLLTALARRSIDGAAPGVAVNGNRAGTGKGLLIDTIGILVSGRSISTSSYPTDKIEADKAKLALGLSGRHLVHFDNLDEGASYGGGAVDSMVTSHTVSGRVLGESRDVEDVPLRVTFFLSGNNISPYKDAYRRWLPCNLVTELERPEERHDLGEERLRHHVLGRRGELVHAALTILRAHAAAGRPKGNWATLGSFEEWDPVVRGAVWFATGKDCCATRSKAADESPERLAKIQLLKGWLELEGGGTCGVTASEAAKEVAAQPQKYPTLHEAFTGMTRDGKVPTGAKIGAKIRGMKNSVTDSMRFVIAGEEHKTTLWRVEVISQNLQPSQFNADRGGDGGHGGDNLNHCAGGFDSNSDVMGYGDTRKAPGGRWETSPLSPPSPPLSDFEEFTL